MLSQIIIIVKEKIYKSKSDAVIKTVDSLPIQSRRCKILQNKNLNATSNVLNSSYFNSTAFLLSV